MLILLDFLLAGVVGYFIRMKATIVLLVIYFGCLFLGALAWPQLFVRYLGADTIVPQTIGILVGAFLRGSRDKSKPQEEEKKEPEKKVDIFPEDEQTIKAREARRAYLDEQATMALQKEKERFLADKNAQAERLWQEEERRKAIERLRVVGNVKKQNQKRQ